MKPEWCFDCFLAFVLFSPVFDDVNVMREKESFEVSLGRQLLFLVTMRQNCDMVIFAMTCIRVLNVSPMWPV